MARFIISQNVQSGEGNKCERDINERERCRYERDNEKNGAGIVIGKGKGNKDYNWSAPHGAGRLYGRKDMIRRLDSGTFYSMEAFEESMKGIYTTSVNRSTFDESPFAYKPWESILEYLYETVDVEQVAKPVYNLKAAGE